MVTRALFLAVLIAVCVSTAAEARTWTSKAGTQIEALLDSVKGSFVVLKKEDGTKVTIARRMLCDEDQAFVDDATGDAAGATVATAVDEDAFMAVVKRRCLRCHKVCTTLDTMVERRWVRPGAPTKSPVYTIIGKHKKQGGKYHDVSDAEKKTIHDFVSTYKPEE